MELGGLQRTTLSDFPGRVACTVFTIGCNLRCPYCHNPELIDGDQSLVESDVFEFLEDRAAVLDGVVVSGGEPTLQDDLPQFVRRVADRGFDVKLDTNGTHPGVLQETIDTGAIDYVAMDLKTRPDRYDDLGADGSAGTAVQRSARIIRESGLDYEFRTTYDQNVLAAEEFGRLAELAGDGPLYVQSVESEGVLVPNAVESTPAAPLAVIRDALGSLPAPIDTRDGSV